MSRPALAIDGEQETASSAAAEKEEDTTAKKPFFASKDEEIESSSDEEAEITTSGDAAVDAAVDDISPYTLLGIEQNNLALGVDAKDFLTYIGTRDDLIERTMKDIPKLSRQQAEVEVDKFLMDQEACNVMIEFNKLVAEDPDFEVPKPPEEGPFSLQTLVYAYLAYVGWDLFIVRKLRENVAEQQAAGEWKSTGFDWLDKYLGAATTTATSAAADAGSTAGVVDADAVSDVVAQSADAVQAAADAAQTVTDVVSP